MIQRLRNFLGSTSFDMKAREEFIEAKLLVYASAFIVAMMVLYLGLADGHGI